MVIALRLLFGLGEIAKVVETERVAGERCQQPTISRPVEIQVFIRIEVSRLDSRPRRLLEWIHIHIGDA